MRPIASTTRDMVRRGPVGLVSVALAAAVPTACCGCTATAGAGDGNETIPDAGDIQADPSQMTGAEGEQPGYNHLKRAGAFEASLETLIEHAYDRRDAVLEHLSTGRAS